MMSGSGSWYSVPHLWLPSLGVTPTGGQGRAGQLSGRRQQSLGPRVPWYLSLPVALRALVHHQGEYGTGPDQRTVEERQRGQSQETPEPGDNKGQELERQGTADGKCQVGI